MRYNCEQTMSTRANARIPIFTFTVPKEQTFTHSLVQVQYNCTGVRYMILPVPVVLLRINPSTNTVTTLRATAVQYLYRSWSFWHTRFTRSVWACSAGIGILINCTSSQSIHYSRTAAVEQRLPPFYITTLCVCAFHITPSCSPFATPACHPPSNTKRNKESERKKEEQD